MPQNRFANSISLPFKLMRVPMILLIYEKCVVAGWPAVFSLFWLHQTVGLTLPPPSVSSGLSHIWLIHRECQLQSLAIEGTLIEMDMVGGNWRRIRAILINSLNHPHTCCWSWRGMKTFSCDRTSFNGQHVTWDVRTTCIRSFSEDWFHFSCDDGNKLNFSVKSQ